MTSIRARLLIALIILVALISLLAAAVTYRRVLNETSTLFDYQLRQMALSLRGQISLAPRIEVPPDQGDTDFVVQIWDIFGDAHLSVAARPAHDQPDGARLRGPVAARGSLAGLWPADRRRRHSDRAAGPSTRGVGARRGGTSRHSARPALAHHDRGGGMDRAPRSQAAAIRCRRSAAPRCAHPAAPGHRQSAAGDRAPGRRTQSPAGAPAAGLCRAARLHFRCRARAAIAAHGAAPAAAAAGSRSG